jgi:DNA-binding MarR family transcriptional regulator
MTAKTRILEHLSNCDDASGKELREVLGISRQALSTHLRTLIASGEVIKTGSTRAARYILASRAPSARVLKRDLGLSNLDEADVYQDLALSLSLTSQLPKPAEAIIRYGFTEMLNNAIDHSEADRCSIRFQLDTGAASFEIRDRGIGIFHSIATKLDLEDEQAAMIELLKGRTTTMRERHSGEGVFFTSKAADRFVLRSHRIQVDWDALKDDVFVAKQRYMPGTRVSFLLRKGTRRRLEDVFRAFAPAEYDFQFQKTRLHVRLLQNDYISRSEARRLLTNLEKFMEVLLDFKHVRTIGQGFADEIFRVFAARYPEILVHTENMNDVVAAMIQHVQTGDHTS